VFANISNNKTIYTYASGEMFIHDLKCIHSCGQVGSEVDISLNYMHLGNHVIYLQIPI